MPPNNNKKKKKARNRSTAAVFCGGCQKKLLDPAGVVPCACTRVNYCSPVCRDLAVSTGKHACEPRTNTNRMQSRPDLASPLDDPTVRNQFNHEYRETIQKHITQLILQEGLAGRPPPDSIGPEYYAKLADRGNAVYGSAQCAYMAGILYKNRMLGNVELDRSGGRTALRSSTAGAADNDHGVLETDELAFKYLKQASDAGIAIAMQSLAELYEKDQGVRERRITANDWLWRSTLLGSSAGIKYLDDKALLPIELSAMVEQLGMMQSQLMPGQSFSLCGPHLTSLLCLFGKQLMTRFRFKLPAFASDLPTLTVGNGIREGTTGPVPLIGSQTLGQLCILTQHLERRGSEGEFTYGRRGVAKEASAQTHGDVNRRIADSFLYKLPPDPQCDDQYAGSELSSFQSTIRQVRLTASCIHSERTPQYFCLQCLEVAQKRLMAVSHGSVAISLYETLPARGLTALWLDQDGNCQSDTFKIYSRGEAETVLASLVACEPRLAHPLFVAQDPNFLWPLVTYHGTVRAALEYVAPHIDWNERLGNVKPVVERLEIAAGAGAGTLVTRCGNGLCTKLEIRGRETTMKDCSGCNSWPYCSLECASADWTVHFHECSGGNRQGLHKRSNKVSAGRSAKVRTPEVGEEVVVHGLIANPEYNGTIGVIDGNLLSSGRYPLKLRTKSSQVISIKPTNVHQLGVSIVQKDGSSSKAKCAFHKQETCSDCTMDFQMLNQLSKMLHAGYQLSGEKIEEIADLYFAGIKTESSLGLHEGDFPLECAGLKGEKERFILSSLLKYTQDKRPKDDSDVPQEIWAAVNGLCCYSARCEPVARPSAVKQLQKTLI